jgi:hypothetical protein
MTVKVVGTQGFELLLRRADVLAANGERIPVHGENVVDIIVRVAIHENCTSEYLPGPGRGLARVPLGAVSLCPSRRGCLRHESAKNGCTQR